jgi:hypothetical protein
MTKRGACVIHGSDLFMLDKGYPENSAEMTEKTLKTSLAEEICKRKKRS